ncbi:MAG: gliding motility-associated C-terminal domain-containing protein [Bacteroidota bacterium]
MKLPRIYLPILFTIICAVSLSAQSATFRLPVVSGCAGETVCMPVTVDDFSDVVEFGFSLRWDETCLEFVNITNRNPIIDGESLMDINTSDAANGILSAFWQQWDADAGETCEALPSGLTIDDEEVLFDICFEVNGPFGTSCDVCPFNEPQPLSVRKKQGNGDCTDDAILGFVCGVASVCVDPLEMAIEVPFGAYQPGDLLCVDMIMEDGFTNIDGLQLGLTWDCSVLELAENPVIPNSDIPNNFPIFYNTSDSCEFFLAWQALPNQPVTLEPDEVFAQICFNIIGECGDDSPISISQGPSGQPVEVTNNNLQLLPTVLTDDFVDIDNCNPNGLDVVFNCPPAGELGDIVCAQVLAGDNFDNITIMEYLVKWNPNILEFVETQNYGLCNFNAGDFDTDPTDIGVLGVEYNSSVCGGQSLDPGDVVYEICFRVIGVAASSFLIGSSPTRIETMPDEGIIGIDPQNCVIDVIQPESVIINLGSADINSSDPVCVPITITGVEDLGSMAFSLQFDNGSFDFINFDNLAIPGAIIDASLAAAAGIITFSYDGPGVTLPNGSTLIELCLQARDDAEPLVCSAFEQINIPIGGQASTVQNPDVNIGLEDIPGELCVLFPEGFGLIFGNGSEGIDSSLCVPVQVFSYDNIISTEFRVRFDPSLLTYTGTNFGTPPPTFIVDDSQQASGIITYSTDNGGVPVNLPDSTVLFEVCFDTQMTPGCSPFFGDSNAEPSATTTNGDGSIVFTDGEICVEDRIIVNQIFVTPTTCPDACNGQLAFETIGGDGQIFIRNQLNPGNPSSNDTLRNVCPGWVTYEIFNNGEPRVSVVDSIFVEFDANSQPIANLNQDTVSLNCTANNAVFGTGNSGTEFKFSRLLGPPPDPSTTLIDEGDVDENGIITVNIPSDGTYVLEVENEFGCSAFDTVVVLPAVFPQAEAGPIDTTLTCAVESITLTGIETSGVDGFYNYVWQREVVGQDPDTISMTEDVMIDSAGTYRLIITNIQSSCTSEDIIQVSDERDPPNIDVPQQTSLGCNGEAAELNTGLFGPQFQTTWVDENMVEVGTQPGFDVTTAGTYTVTVLNTDNQCESSVTVTVAEGGGNPVINLPAEPITLYCSSDSTPILVTYTNVSPSVNYTWTTTDGILALGQFTRAQPIVLSTGTYQVVADDNGCIDSIEVVVGESVLPQVEAGNDIPLACDAPTLIDAANDTDQGDPFSYQWLYEGEPIDGATSIQTFANDGLGVYTLVVTNDITGCVAQDFMTITGSEEVPAVSLPDTAGILTCAIETLELVPEVQPIDGNYSYMWTGGPGTAEPDGSFIASAGGVYFVEVTNEDSGCSSLDSTFIDASFGIPPFVFLSNDTVGITCDRPTRLLDGSQSEDGDNISYQWDNFQDGETPDPDFINTDSLRVGTAGIYTLTVINEDTQCSATDTIVVTDTRVFPMADTLPVQRLDCDNPTTQIGITIQGNPDNFTVFWAGCLGADLPDGPIIEVDCPGNYNYTIIDNISGCFTNGSLFVAGDIDTTANIEFEEPDIFDCTSTSLTLEANYTALEAPDLISWESLEGNTIIPETGSLIVSVDGPGIYVLTIESPTVCSITDTIMVEADQNTPVADAGMDIELSCDQTVFLDAGNSTQGADFSYLWTALEGGIASGEDPTQQMVQATGPGLYVIEVTNDLNLCSDSDTIRVTANEAPADAGPDQFICEDEACVTGNQPAGFVGTWTAIELGGATFDANAGENTACVTGITQPVTLVWTISLAGGSSTECDDADTVVISPAVAPIAVDDNLLVDNGTGNIDLSQNDDTSGPFTITLLNEPEFGTFTSNINGRLTYQAPDGVGGTFTVDYEICSTECEGLCDQGTLTVRVEAEGIPDVYNAITPNDDGLNDRFVFEILEFGNPDDFPDNEFILFNRWGDILYEAKPYLNDFNGTLPDGTVLAEGTYYYILRLNLGEGQIFRGDLTIVR